MTTTNQSQTVTIPDLEHYCGSWIVVSRETGGAVFETYSRETAERINQEKYEVLTAYQWLVRFNQTVKETITEHDINLDSPLLPYSPADVSFVAATLGRLGGQSTTPAKIQASRTNGKKGGRPAHINSDAFD